jgi:hypothetical protein
MTTSRWRDIANVIIARVVSDNPGLPEYELRKRLSAAYPFGERNYHPYKIWLSAINEHFDPRPKERKAKTVVVNEGQLLLGVEADNE